MIFTKSKLQLILFSLKLLAYLVLITSLASCTVVEISNGNDQVSIQRHFGFVTIKAEPTTQAIVAKLRSLGFSSTPIGNSFGYSKKQIALLPRDCRLVIWVESAEEYEILQELISDTNSVCPISTK